MVSTVENILAEGFTLSSRAMNCYIQLLCDSPDPQIIIIAFKTAEHFVMPPYDPGEERTPNEEVEDQRIHDFVRQSILLGEQDADEDIRSTRRFAVHVGGLFGRDLAELEERCSRVQNGDFDLGEIGPLVLPFAADGNRARSRP